MPPVLGNDVAPGVFPQIAGMPDWLKSYLMKIATQQGPAPAAPAIPSLLSAPGANAVNTTVPTPGGQAPGGGVMGFPTRTPGQPSMGYPALQAPSFAAAPPATTGVFNNPADSPVRAPLPPPRPGPRPVINPASVDLGYYRPGVGNARTPVYVPRGQTQAPPIFRGY